MKKYRRLLIIVLAIMVLLKTTNFSGNNMFFGKDVSEKGQVNCTIQLDNSVNNIEAAQYGKRIWESFCGFILLIFIFNKCITVKRVFPRLTFYLIIDLREYILRFMTTYFHGSKYKDGGLLSTL